MAPSLILAELVARASTPEEGQADGRKFKSYYIIGIVIIALLVVGAVAFVLVRRWKKRAAFERVGEDRIQALSLNVRGIMLENDEKRYARVLLLLIRLVNAHDLVVMASHYRMTSSCSQNRTCPRATSSLKCPSSAQTRPNPRSSSTMKLRVNSLAHSRPSWVHPRPPSLPITKQTNGHPWLHGRRSIAIRS